MKFMTQHARLLLALMFLPLGATAQSLSDLEQLGAADRRSYWDAMSPQERRAKREQLRAERDAMPADERRAMRDRRQQDRRARYDNMSDEERAAARTQREQRRAQRKERFNSMSPADRNTMRRRHEQRRRDRGERDRQRRRDQ